MSRNSSETEAQTETDAEAEAKTETETQHRLAETQYCRATYTGRDTCREHTCTHQSKAT